MTPRFALRAVLAISCALCFSPTISFAARQDGEESAEETAALEVPSMDEAVAACSDPEVETKTLQAYVKVFTQAQLTELADAWIGHVQGAQTAVAAATVAEDSDAATEAREARDALISRTNVVLAELSAKGGDASAQQGYLDAIAPVTDVLANAMPADLGQAKKMLGNIKDWFVSSDGGIKWGLNILKFLVIIMVFKVISGLLGKVVGKAVGRLKKASSLLKDFFITSVMKITMFVGFVIALSTLGVDIGPFLAAMGAAGFVIGFALQGTLSNFAAGVMILIYRPYDIGNVVTASGVTGKVQAMSLVSTTLLTPDNQTIIIPNGSIWGSVITNITANDTRRVDMVFGIGYGDDIDKAQTILEEVLGNHPKVLKDLGITVKVGELADSSVNFIARPWTKTVDYWDVYWDLHRDVKQRFDKEGISIPFPQSDVHVHGLQGQSEAAKA